MNLFMHTFTEALPPNARILDLGAGEGHQARGLAARGHRVVAVDRRPPGPAHPNVEWHEADILDWLDAHAETAFDAALFGNVLQFFSPEEVEHVLIPATQDLIRPGGVIAVAAFTRAPEPPFPSAHPSYWRTSDLKRLFPEWQILLAQEISDRHPGLDGTERLFHTTQIVARKPS